MKVITTIISDVMVIEPRLFVDDRGFFMKVLIKKITEETRVTISLKNLLQALHYQIQQPQRKLVRAVVGEVLDVAVDIRKSSPIFG